jgi:bifunctional N6-L-threonylcarbamoyladenine synthase / protein kinase Bud32
MSPPVERPTSSHPARADGVRRAQLADAAWLEALATSQGLQLDLKALLEVPQARVYVAPPERGFLSVWLVQDEIQIQDLAVEPRFQRQGLGRALLTRAIGDGALEGARFASLEVRESNQKALSFYAALEFVEVGRRPRYYSDGEAALLLARHFGEGR